MELATLTSDQYRRAEATDLWHVLSAQAFASRDGLSPVEYYRKHFGTSPTAPVVLRAFEWAAKAAVSAGTTTDPAWAKPLVGSQLTAFLTLARQASVLGQIPVTPAPFETPLPYRTGTGAASLKWVAQGAPKPVTKLALDSFTLTPTKGAGIIVVSTELMRFARPGANAFVQTSVVNDLTAFVDTTLLSAAAATPESPAGILAGVTASASIAATVAAFAASRPRALTPTWIVSAANLSQLTLDIHGKLKNYPVVTSPNAGANLILVDAPALIVADAGLDMETSEEALLQMDDAPTPPAPETVYVNLWQSNLIGVRVERTINWKILPGAVQFTATLS